MQFLNPKTDFAFKKIFGSEQSHDILLSFLNAILELRSPYRIAEVKILDPYQAPKIVGMKDTFVDVQAIDENGKRYIIEMQVLNVQGFEQRVLYNACKAYANQIRKGEDYHMLTDVIALTITDFVMFPERNGVVSKFKLRATDGELYSDDLELVFAELPKFDKPENALVDIQDKWLYFLQHADDLALIPPAFLDEPSLVHAFEIANRANLTVEEEEAQCRREIFIQDQRGAIEKAKTEGRTEGEREATLRIARSLLASMDDISIAAATGLPPAEVAGLRRGQQE
jgi:predicted transposase/invertase (TIGR01784 family)